MPCGWLSTCICWISVFVHSLHSCLQCGLEALQLLMDSPQYDGALLRASYLKTDVTLDLSEQLEQSTSLALRPGDKGVQHSISFTRMGSLFLSDSLPVAGLPLTHLEG